MAKSKFWDFLELLSSFIFVVLLLILFWRSVVYWTGNYPNFRPIDDQLFYIGVGVAVVTTVAQWIEGRIKSIIRSYNSLKGGLKNGKKSS